MELLEGEFFKTIPKFEGRYEVSNKGRVRSLLKGPRSLVNGGIRALNTIRPEGYRGITLILDTKKIFFRVHRLVAIVFLPNPEGYSTVDHIDGDVNNNCLENLRWCSKRQNLTFSNVKWKQKKASKYTGVYFRKEIGMFYSKIQINKLTYHLGYFAKEEDAAEAYRNAIPKHEVT